MLRGLEFSGGKKPTGRNHLFIIMVINKQTKNGKTNLTIQKGNTKIVTISDQLKYPKCSRMDRVVWVSKDGKTARIQCPATHSQMSRPNSKLGSSARTNRKQVET
ncbi:MAG: hypothetical protein KGD70_15365 [Candidatus Lokiarchaeota archaeon]|nr:hypothetical protein [Candidatus Lokiarchaeota archaeon]